MISAVTIGNTNAGSTHSALLAGYTWINACDWQT